MPQNLFFLKPTLKKILNACLAKHVSPDERVVVGFSGGLDSSVLLDVLLGCWPSQKIGVIHVDHGIHPDSAQWAQEASSVCLQNNIPIYVEKIDPGLPSENVLRQKRYAVFQRGLDFFESKILLLAHHADDQAETLMMRLNRGAGFWGAMGIPVKRAFAKGFILRPFLTVTRAQLVTHAQQKNLIFSTDPSNGDLQYERNFLRHCVWPLIEKQRPGARRRWAEWALLQQTTWNLLAQHLDQAILPYLSEDNMRLNCLFLKGGNDTEQALKLKFWLEKKANTAPLEYHHLAEIQNTLLGSRADACPLFSWGDPKVPWVLRRYREKLYLARNPLDRQMAWREKPDWAIQWDGQTPLMLPHQKILHPIQIQNWTGFYWVKVYYQTGGGAALKKKWQQAEVPPWARRFTPVLYAEDGQTWLKMCYDASD